MYIFISPLEQPGGVKGVRPKKSGTLGHESEHHLLPTVEPSANGLTSQRRTCFRVYKMMNLFTSDNYSGVEIN